MTSQNSPINKTSYSPTAYGPIKITDPTKIPIKLFTVSHSSFPRYVSMAQIHPNKTKFFSGLKMCHSAIHYYFSAQLNGVQSTFLGTVHVLYKNISFMLPESLRASIVACGIPYCYYAYESRILKLKPFT